MENVLFINACVRPDSRTRILAQEVLDCLGQPYTEVDLNREQYPAMDRQALELREDLRRTELRTHPRFAPAWQFARADIIVVAAPFWDLSFPGLLKNYIEYINVSAKIISSAADSILDPLYFSGTDNHLSTEGVAIHTQAVIGYLTAALSEGGRP